jgi:hypothetical protein
MTSGIREPEVPLGSFHWGEFSEKSLMPPPVDCGDGKKEGCLRGRQVIVRPGGYLL